MNQKLQILFFCLIAFTLGGFAIYWLNFPKASAQYVQKQSVHDGFKYCAVTKIVSEKLPAEPADKVEGIAEIKYFGHYKERNTDRDRYISTQEVRIEIFYGDILNDTKRPDSPENRKYATVHAADLAFANALGILGNNGYEVVGTRFEKLPFENAFNQSEMRNAIFFQKRNYVK